MLVPLYATSPPPARADRMLTPGALMSASVFEKSAMARPVWRSLTGRKPSVNKVADEQRSDFVTFVQELAKIAGGPEPTFKQVQSAFRVRTPD